MEKLYARTFNSNTYILVDQLPDTCPHCHYSGYFAHTSTSIDGGAAFLSFYCSRNECNRFFVYQYDSAGEGLYTIDRPINGTFKGVKYSEIITDISASFVEIYHQAEQSEHIGLKDICGVAYRKALEFLIKDYIISNNPDIKSKVENKLLAQCIGDHIENKRIVDISKRAVWLGNDETHYIRKWEGMDISHLKSLIALAVHWIETEELTKKMITDMPDTRK